ncbi:MAG: MarR family winged helix-turn-helix transcriptional regulator [Bacteroidota bacterium]
MQILPPSPNFDRVQPRQCVNAKLRKLHRLIDALYQARFKPFGLRGSMTSILFIIGKRPGIHQKVLAELLILDPSTMSRDLKKLISQGWIRSEKGSDARQTMLYLTAEGVHLLEDISPLWEELHGKVTRLLGDFQMQQIDAITQAIQQEMANLQS